MFVMALQEEGFEWAQRGYMLNGGGKKQLAIKVSAAHFARLAGHQGLDIQLRKFPFIDDVRALIALENDKVLRVLRARGQIVGPLHALGCRAVAQIVNLFNDDPRIRKLVFFEQRPDRLIKRLILIKVDDHLHVIRDRLQSAFRDGREIRPGARGDAKACKVTSRQIIEHCHERQDGQGGHSHVQADTPPLQTGKALRRLASHGFQRRLSTTRKVRTSSKKVELKYNTSGLVSMTPRVKSCICSSRLR